MLEWRNEPIVKRIQNLIEIELPDQKLIPTGLGLAMSGTATVGRDMLIAGQESAKKTDLATLVLVATLASVVFAIASYCLFRVREHRKLKKKPAHAVAAPAVAEGGRPQFFKPYEPSN